ncbi:hypothetical protein H696_01735 [Fonticula alba]|uniref:Ubiquilin n=1 Tax=Fonticula alba TaxID=691883 RepID=A0A058ZEG7_FONAL|nr:hypothetical protein H696_01735 [Fonticula alba]KCV72341.1 hypothetical protein H696_01735 [Fonticula alba]|eukprot:XP_009493919.1 hypothetical protein H696_01735 [Fonticula alba]
MKLWICPFNSDKFQVEVDDAATTMDLKEAIAKVENSSAETQRLIFAGSVLKDSEQLSSYNIVDGVSIHYVRGRAPRAAAAAAPAAAPARPATTPAPAPAAAPRPASAATPSAASVPTNISAGFDPSRSVIGAGEFSLANADLGSILSAIPGGLSSLIGDGEEGSSGLPDFEAVNQLLSQNPALREQMSQMMSDPAMMESLMNNPMFRDMLPPGSRNLMSNPAMIRLAMDPEFVQLQAQMQAVMQRHGVDLSSMMGGGGGMFGAAGASGAGSPSASQEGTNRPAAGPGAMPSLAHLEQLLSAFGGAAGAGAGAAGGSPFNFGGAAAAAQAPAEPPESRFQVQLSMLQDMGFHDSAANIRALLSSGGRVDAAVEYLLRSPPDFSSGGGSGGPGSPGSN